MPDDRRYDFKENASKGRRREGGTRKLRRWWRLTCSRSDGATRDALLPPRDRRKADRDKGES